MCPRTLTKMVFFLDFAHQDDPSSRRTKNINKHEIHIFILFHWESGDLSNEIELSIYHLRREPLNYKQKHTAH